MKGKSRRSLGKPQFLPANGGCEDGGAECSGGALPDTTLGTVGCNAE